VITRGLRVRRLASRGGRGGRRSGIFGGMGVRGESMFLSLSIFHVLLQSRSKITKTKDQQKPRHRELIPFL
jgi:hypothetical protein